MNKKKYFTSLLILLFGMLLSTYSNCFAKTNVTEDYIKWSMENIMKNYTNSQTNIDKFNNWYNDEFVHDVWSHINDMTIKNSIDKLNNNNMYTFISTPSNTEFYFYFIFSNNSAPDNIDIPFIGLKYDTEYNLKIVPMEDKNTISSTEKLYYLGIDLQNSKYSFFDGTIGSSGKNRIFFAQAKYEHTINNDDEYIAYLQYASFPAGAMGYFIYPYNSSSTTYYMHLANWNNATYTPAGSGTGGGTGGTTGSGEQQEGSGGTSGGTTDLSGVTGKLDDVNKNLGEIQEKIPSSGDVQNAVNKGNQDYWGDVSGEQANNEMGNIIDDVQENLNKEMEKSKIFDTLEKAEKGFLDLISGQAEDFKIEWQAVEYEGNTIIPAGSVNFSEMCRNDETLGNVKKYLNIILSAFMSFSIIHYIYNLFLSTLGINNTFLYEDTQESGLKSTYDVNTGITTYTGKDKDGKNFVFRTGRKK